MALTARAGQPPIRRFSKAQTCSIRRYQRHWVSGYWTLSKCFDTLDHDLDLRSSAKVTDGQRVGACWKQFLNSA